MDANYFCLGILKGCDATTRYFDLNYHNAIDTKVLKKICEVGNGLITIHQVPCLVADRNSFSRTYDFNDDAQPRPRWMQRFEK